MAVTLFGLDFGTGGAKACIMDAMGNVRAYAYEEYPLIHDHPGWSEHDPKNYWEVTCRLIKKCLADSNTSPHNIKGIAISSALPSMVMVDKNHQPVHRAYNLMDKRAVDEVKWLEKHIGTDRLFQLSGNRLEDHPVLVNVLWEKRNRPESFAQVKKVLTIDGYIALKLTGQATLHYSAAAFYGVAYDMRNRRFDETLFKEFGIDLHLLPELCDCTNIIGNVTEQAARETGLAPQIPVAGGQVDCNASWVGAGAISAGDMQSNLGTVGNFGIIHQNIDFCFSDIGRLMINFPYTVDSKNMFITVPTTMTGGQCLRYIRDTLSHYEIESERLLGVSAYDLLNLQAQKIPPGSEGLVVLPFFMGERTPIWDADARAVMFGLTLNHSKSHIVRAMMEGVAFAMYDSFRLIKEAKIKINYPMVLNEGGAVSPLWRQIITDVFNVPITLVKRRTGAPYGDAILAGVSTGFFADFNVVKDWVEYVEPMQPDPQTHEIYMEYFSLFKDIYQHVKNDFKKLSTLRNMSNSLTGQAQKE